MKINTLEIENFKRVKAVKLEPSANGLTIIGGKNGQGTTLQNGAPTSEVRTMDENKKIAFYGGSFWRPDHRPVPTRG